jgi:hypothetical protein
MSIHLEWIDPEKTILLVKYEPGWTLEDYHRYIEQSGAMIREQNHIVDMISNFNNNRPSGKNMLSALSRIKLLMPPNSGTNVVVKPDGFTRVIIESAVKMPGSKKAIQNVPHFAIRFGNSVEEATTLLRNIQQARIASALPQP